MISPSDHFQGKSSAEHVVEKQARGVIASSESHGVEMSGSLSAATDAARETTVILLLLSVLLNIFSLPFLQIFFLLVLFTFGWLLWKICRSAWLGWSRLERLHRILEEERWEIEHNRPQEREELRALYQMKGFEGKLLEEVLDVLMADGDRLLRVMVEEELGLSLESQEHPLKQGLGAGVGVLLAGIVCLLGLWLWPPGGLYIAALATISVSALLIARLQGNRLTSAIIWNIAMVLLVVLSTFFLLEYLLQQGWWHK